MARLETNTENTNKDMKRLHKELADTYEVTGRQTITMFLTQDPSIEILFRSRKQIIKSNGIGNSLRLLQ